MRYQSHRKTISKLIITLIVIMLALPCGTLVAYADSGFGITDEFDDLNGDSKYLGSDYRDNYKLDVEKLGMTEVGDKVMNEIANVVFSCIHFIGYTASVIFYFAMDFDLAQLLKSQIEAIQAVLHESVFSPLIQVGIVGAIIIAIARFAKRDFIGLMEQFGKVIFIVFLSFMVVKDSTTILSYATGITKSISVSILTGTSGGTVNSNVTDFAAESAGTLWISLVHNPWLSLEFGDYSYTEDNVEELLSTSSESERKDIVKSMMDGDDGPFAKGRNAEKIGNGVMILLTVIFKGAVYVGVAILQVGFQALAIFYVMLAPLILILSLFPGYDFQVLAIWTKKILETQVGVLLLTFLMGFMILIDNAMSALASTLGWFVVLIIQIVIYVFLFMNRNKILHLLSEAQRGAQNPGRVKMQFKQSGNMYRGIEEAGKNYTRQQTINTAKRRRDISEPTEIPRTLNNFDRQGVNNSLATTEMNRPTLNQAEGRQLVQDRQSGYNNAAFTAHEMQYQGTGIKSDSHYAPYSVTDNWRELWYAERPKTTDNDKSIHRKPMPSQQGRMPTETTRKPLTAYEMVSDDNRAIEAIIGQEMSISESKTQKPVTFAIPEQYKVVANRKNNYASPRISNAKVHIPESRLPSTSVASGRAALEASGPLERPRTAAPVSQTAISGRTASEASGPSERPRTAAPVSQTAISGRTALETSGLSERPRTVALASQTAVSGRVASETSGLSERFRTVTPASQTAVSGRAASETSGPSERPRTAAPASQPTESRRAASETSGPSECLRTASPIVARASESKKYATEVHQLKSAPKHINQNVMEAKRPNTSNRAGKGNDKLV